MEGFRSWVGRLPKDFNLMFSEEDKVMFFYNSLLDQKAEQI